MFARLLFACAIGIGLAGAAHAEYPDRPIRFVLHVSPGGATDIMGRKIAQGLEKELGVPVIIENKAGGRGAAQLADLKTAKADGYTIGSVTNTHVGAFNQTLKQYTVNDFDWIARLVTEPYLIAVRSDSKIMSLKDLAKVTNEKPGSVVIAGFVRGSGGHFAWEMMAKALGLDSSKVKWVPYDSAGDAVTALLGGHGEVTIHHVDLVKDHVAAGTMRVIGIMANERAVQFPDAPTLKQQEHTCGREGEAFRCNQPGSQES
jgi:tripartite-type tricarboxylate transporter receptor subunit TctC